MKPKRIKIDERDLARMIENDIDYFIEQKHLTEIPLITEGLGMDYDD